MTNAIRAFILSTLVALSGHSAAMRGQEVRDSKPRPGSISGYLTVDGEPGAGVGISLFAGDYSNGKPIATARTEDDGSYRFGDVPSGHYCLSVDSPDLVDAASSLYGGMRWKVSVANGQAVENVSVLLVRGGVISGRVTNTDGIPVPNERVSLRPANSGLGWGPIDLRRGPFATDGSGAFVLFGIPPGKYLVSIGVDVARLRGDVWDKNDFYGPFGRLAADHFYEETFFPGVTDKQLAQIIDVAAGGKVDGIEITLGRPHSTYKVSGRVIDARTEQGIPNCGLQVMQRVNQGYRGAGDGMFRQDKTDENGDFTISGLIPGRFFIGATFDEGAGNFYGRRLDFEIKGADIAGLQVKVDHGLTLAGGVVLAEPDKELAAKVPQLALSVWLKTGEFGSVDSFRHSTVGSDGSFLMSGLRRGVAEMDLDPSSASGYFSISRIEFPNPENERQIEVFPAEHGRCRLQIGDRDIKSARVVLAYHNATIKCHVAITGSLPVGVRLYAWVSHSNSVCMAPLDANGEFILDGLEPGDYEVEIGDETGRLTEKKTVKVEKNAQTSVSFVLDAKRIAER